MNKKRKPYLWIFSLVIISFIASITYVQYPTIVDKIYEHRSFSKANLKVKNIKINGQIMTYAEGGAGQTLFFLHGFQGDKRFWIKYVKPFISSYHIVIPDLPGHGGSSYNESHKFDLKSLSHVINEFAKAKKIDKFQLTGTSLGAGVCMQYSILFPEKVKKLILLNPIGIRPADENEYFDRVKINQSLFFPSNINELDKLNIYLTGSPLNCGENVKKYILNRLNKKRAFFQRAYTELVSGEGVEKELSKILAPTLIISGAFDQIAKPSDLEIYSSNISGCKVLLLDSYHVFKGSSFEKALKAMEEFINNN